MLTILTAVVFFKPFDKLIFQNRNFPGRQEIKKSFSSPDHSKISEFRDKDFPHDFERDPNHGPHIDVASNFLFFLIIFASITKETNKQLSITTQRALIAEAEKIQAELSFLKAQINPHFLFNNQLFLQTFNLARYD